LRKIFHHGRPQVAHFRRISQAFRINFERNSVGCTRSFLDNQDNLMSCYENFVSIMWIYSVFRLPCGISL
jgi:hypothetical protein